MKIKEDGVQVNNVSLFYIFDVLFLLPSFFLLLVVEICYLKLELLGSGRLRQRYHLFWHSVLLSSEQRAIGGQPP